MTSSLATDPLLGPKLKIARAKRHLSDFEATLKAFGETQPYELITEIDGKTGEQVFRVRIHKYIQDEVSIITGDVVHNLRSALDQLVCGLVRANNKQVSGGNGFPIMGSAKRFEESRVGKLKNISAKADRFIRRLKPYKGGHDALWMLSELDNMDKHNAIIPVAAGQVMARVRIGMPGLFVTPDGRLSIGGGPPGFVPFGFHRGWGTPEGARVVELLHDNCEIYRWNTMNVAFPYEIYAPISITFGKTQVTNYEPMGETLDKLIQLVERMINIVERRIL